MKRRDLIKLGILAAGAGLAPKCDLSCEGKNIIPRQSGPNIFSVPMPYDYALLDELADYNEGLKKSKITTVYNNMPVPYSEVFHEEFQANKSYSPNVKNYKDFAKYVTYAQEKGFHFIYILNSPKPFSDETYKKREKHLKRLFDVLKGIGVTEIKVANTQLMTVISEETDFDLSASTSFEYHNVSQFKNLFETYKRIKTIDIAIDDNRNFLYLSKLRKLLPDTNIELIVNERCIHGCPARISHSAAHFKVWDCISVCEKMGQLEYFFKSNLVYPWQLEAYRNIGINNFKLMANRYNLSSLKFMLGYLDCVENGTDNLSANDLFDGIYQTEFVPKKNPKLNEILPFLPDIEHFVKNGDKCANICDIDCTYCLKCAKKVKEMIL